ncbi:hypothetical protein FGO68_gene13199 [Halteria grandinella]|uniref:Uncharacterized protein n=1 Tax=Halteria grandinella TaxID=5974 RepID=A0A8J8NNP4_HALGN|nr:hypothetical protein FGO68_gene13199 [Halteria grandinella]
MEPQDQGNCANLCLSDLKQYIGDYHTSLAIHEQNKIRQPADRFQKRLCDSFIDFLYDLIKMGIDSNLTEEIKGLACAHNLVTQSGVEEVRNTEEESRLRREVNDLNQRLQSSTQSQERISKEKEELLKKVRSLESDVNMYLAKSLMYDEDASESKRLIEEETTRTKKATENLLKVHGDFTNAQKNYQLLKEKYDQMSDQHTNTIAELKLAKQKLISEKQVLQTSYDKLKEQLEAKISELNRFQQLRPNQADGIRSQPAPLNLSMSLPIPNIAQRQAAAAPIQGSARDDLNSSQNLKPDSNLSQRFSNVCLQIYIKSKVLPPYVSSASQKFKLHKQFAPNEFRDYGATFRTLQTQIFLVAVPAKESTQFQANQFVCVHLDLADFNWRDMTVFMYKAKNQLFVIEPLNGVGLPPYVKQSMEVEVKFSNKKFEIVMQKKGDIKTLWNIDLSNAFDMYTLN